MTTKGEMEAQWLPRLRRPSRADMKASQIYETAARLFHQKGYGSTSLQDIASAVGLQKASLYYYINSKEDLLFEITEYAHEFFNDVVTNNETSELSPVEKLESVLQLHAEFATRRLHVTAAFYNDRAALSDERQQRIVKARDDYERRLRELIKEGQEAGDINPELDPKMAVFGIMGMINWMHQWYRADGEFGPEEIAATFSSMAVRSLRP